MKKILTCVVVLLMMALLTGCGANVQTKTAKATTASGKAHKVLIAYYSHSGTTEAAAKEIQKQLGADIYRIQTNLTYPKNAPGTLNQVKQEYVAQIRPELKNKVKDFAQYDSVILGFPNWFDDPPMGVFSFLEQEDWQGKTIYPFVTYGLGGFGSSLEDIQKSVGNAALGKGLMLHASIARKADKQIAGWLKDIGLTIPREEK